MAVLSKNDTETLGPHQGSQKILQGHHSKYYTSSNGL